MKYNKIYKYGLFWLLFLVFFGTSCQKIGKEYYGYQQQTSEFDGTVLDYLKAAGGYDSMLLVIDSIPGLADTLSTDSVTCFAIPNQCFSNAITDLNTFLSNSGQPNMYLSQVDKPILDSLISCYIFDGYYTTDSLSVDAQGVTVPSAKYGYNMHLQYGISGSSGYVNGGTDVITLSDMNNSILRTDWQNATTRVVNIKANHAVIHVLSDNHEFGFSRLTEKINQKLFGNDSTTTP